MKRIENIKEFTEGMQVVYYNGYLNLFEVIFASSEVVLLQTSSSSGVSRVFKKDLKSQEFYYKNEYKK